MSGVGSPSTFSIDVSDEDGVSKNVLLITNLSFTSPISARQRKLISNVRSLRIEGNGYPIFSGIEKIISIIG